MDFALFCGLRVGSGMSRYSVLEYLRACAGRGSRSIFGPIPRMVRVMGSHGASDEFTLPSAGRRTTPMPGSASLIGKGLRMSER